MLPNLKKTETDSPRAASGFGASPASLGGNRPASSIGRSGDRGAPSIIGPDLVISGNLFTKGEVQIDGEVQGDIQGTFVVIGEKAHITGGIVADEIVVRGHVLGSVRGKRVMLQSSSHVEGDVFHTSLAIEQGAYFEGKSRRSEDPTAGVVRPDANLTPIKTDNLAG